MLLTRTEELREFRDSGELSDICVIVDNTEFNLHKFPLILNSEFFRALCRCGMMDERRVSLAELPGGAKTFSMIADYCYGLELDINSGNVVQLRCAAEFLQMTSQGNLASETTASLTKMLSSQATSVSNIMDMISSAYTLGAIASQTNIIPLCFDALFTFMKKKRNISETILEVLMGLPLELFVGFIIGARDASVALPIITRLAGKYLERKTQQHMAVIDEYLQQQGTAREVHTEETFNLEAFGDIMDAVLLELPDRASLSKVIDNEMLCLLFRLSTLLSCKCEGMLLTAISNNLSNVGLLVTMSPSSVGSILEHSVHNNNVSPTILCNIVDRYLWERTKLKQITLGEFEAIVRTIPKAYRPQHNSLLLITEELFSTMKLSEETKLKTLDIVDAYSLHEETLRQVSERKVIPSSFIVSSALAVSSRLRNELTEAKAKLLEKDKVIQEVHAGISEVIQGQWEHNNHTLNVTPKDESNRQVQFAKVLPHNTNTGLAMEHEVYDGKLTLCVRSRGKPMQTFLFEPFNEQLIEITQSKHDNLVVGENYHKKKHTTSYWPFMDVVS